jgi:DNA invertase Pin-like site-specific DNA recombinase
MLGVFAEFEQSMIVERVKADLNRARAEGKVLGRPRGGPAVGATVLALRRKERACGSLRGRLGSGTAPCNGL